MKAVRVVLGCMVLGLMFGTLSGMEEGRMLPGMGIWVLALCLGALGILARRFE